MVLKGHYSRSSVLCSLSTVVLKAHFSRVLSSLFFVLWPQWFSKVIIVGVLFFLLCSLAVMVVKGLCSRVLNCVSLDGCVEGLLSWY